MKGKGVFSEARFEGTYSDEGTRSNQEKIFKPVIFGNCQCKENHSLFLVGYALRLTREYLWE